MQEELKKWSNWEKDKKEDWRKNLFLCNLGGPLWGDIPIADDKHPAIDVELLEGVRSSVGRGGVAEGDHHHPQRVAVNRQAAWSKGFSLNLWELVQECQRITGVNWVACNKKLEALYAKDFDILESTLFILHEMKIDTYKYSTGQSSTPVTQSWVTASDEHGLVLVPFST